MATQTKAFWQIKSLQQMTEQEWESLCDGCGYCCLHKLQDEDTGDIYLTNIACEFLNLENCQCENYSNRLQQVEMCRQITPQNIAELTFLPVSCAYRCLHEGRALPQWLPLISEKKQIFKEQHSVHSFAQCELNIHPDEWQNHILKKL